MKYTKITFLDQVWVNTLTNICGSMIMDEGDYLQMSSEYNVMNRISVFVFVFGKFQFSYPCPIFLSPKDRIFFAPPPFKQI